MTKPSPSAPLFNLSRTERRVIEHQVDSLLARMTLDEKVGQLTQYTSDRDVTGPSLNADYEEDIKAGRVGAIFNAFDAEFTRALQALAVDNSRLGIPLLFGYDVIHGFRTIFPVPLAQAASWHIEAIEGASRIAAVEASAAGIHWAFAPMVDIARDPRWGRVVEGAGEDPYLASLIAAAQVRGLQGGSAGARDSVAACVKHFAAYGAVEAGRDYNNVDMSEWRLRSVYLPPFKAAIDAGCATLMTAFNALNGVPASCNPLLLDTILRREWGFEGFVVTDYTAVMELIAHGVARDGAEASQKAVLAGVDMDMQDGFFMDALPELVQRGAVAESRIDDAVRRVLRVKFALGLFEDPYRYVDPERERTMILTPAHRQAARALARESMVLLKNDGVLPLDDGLRTLAVLGPLADDRANVLGPWHADGQAEQAVSLLDGLRQRLGGDTELLHEMGVSNAIGDRDTRGIAAAVEAARRADAVILALGESEQMSGEAASRADIGLPGMQLELARQVIATGKPVAVVLMNGRPLELDWLAAHAPALLEAWWPGSEAGHAIGDVLFGDHNPCGRLPMSFPRTVGQIPLHYDAFNTGRPIDPDEKYTSKYLDVANRPLYPFGFGLSYTTFEYGEPLLERDVLTADEALAVSIRLANRGARAGTEVVQLYLRDLAASVIRPVKELKAFQRVTLGPGESRLLTFWLTEEDLAFLDAGLERRVESGRFRVMIGANSRDVQEVEFVYRAEQPLE